MRLKFDKISPHRHTGMYDNSTKQFMVSYEIDVNFLYTLDVYDTVFLLPHFYVKSVAGPSSTCTTSLLFIF